MAGELAEKIANPVANPQTLTQSAANPANPISSPFAEICKLLSQLTDSERQKLAEILTQPQPKPEQPAETPNDRPASDTVQNQPPLPVRSDSIAPKPATESKHKNFKKGDRVVVAYDDRSLFEGAKGKVFRVKGDDVTIDFSDQPVRGIDFNTFNLAHGTVLMKLP